MSSEPRTARETLIKELDIESDIAAMRDYPGWSELFAQAAAALRAAPAPTEEVGQELARRADQLGLLAARGAREGNVPDEVFFRETAFWLRRAFDEILRQRRWIDDALAYESKMPTLEDKNRALRAALRAAGEYS